MRRRNSRRSLLAALPISLGLGATITHGVTVDPEPEPVTVPAVTQPVRVDLDDRAIPTIAAESPADAFAALGWLHAR